MSTDTYDDTRMSRDRPDGLRIGDRVMVFDPDDSGRYYQGVVLRVYDEDGTLDALYNTAGRFSDTTGEHVEAKSLTPETPDSGSRVWFDGWFDGSDEWWASGSEGGYI